MRVEGAFESPPRISIQGAPPGDVCAWRSPDADALFYSEGGEEQSCVAPPRGVRTSGSENCIENLDGGLCEARYRFVIAGVGEQREIDRASGAGDECVREGSVIGDLPVLVTSTFITSVLV